MQSANQQAVIRLRVQGMRCHSCEQVLTTWLSDIRGVETVLPNYSTGQVVIYADPEVSMDSIRAAIKNAGFVPGEYSMLVGTDPVAGAEMPIVVSRADTSDLPSSYRRVKLSALGMHCDACEKLVTMSTMQVPGVVLATGDSADHSVTVYLNREVALDDLSAAVTAAGFTPGRPFVRGMTIVTELPGESPEAPDTPQAEPAAATVAPAFIAEQPVPVAPAPVPAPRSAAGSVAAATAASAAIAARVASVVPPAEQPAPASTLFETAVPVASAAEVPVADSALAETVDVAAVETVEMMEPVPASIPEDSEPISSPDLAPAAVAEAATASPPVAQDDVSPAVAAASAASAAMAARLARMGIGSATEAAPEPSPAASFVPEPS